MLKKAIAKPVSKTVKLSLSAPGAKEVYLVGEFNQWNPTKTPLKHDKYDGVWIGSIKLQPGKYQYKFVVDGEWWTDPNCPSWVWNEHGTHNSVLEV